MHIKVIEQSRLIYQRQTFEGIVEIDGKEVRFRYSEDDNGSEVYIWNGTQWEDMNYDNPSHIDLSEVCLEIGPANFGKNGAEWDHEAED